jgi:hypothetical protein
MCVCVQLGLKVESFSEKYPPSLDAIFVWRRAGEKGLDLAPNLVALQSLLRRELLSPLRSKVRCWRRMPAALGEIWVLLIGGVS